MDSQLFDKGIQNMKLKNYEEAIYCFIESLELNPQKSTPWYNMGIAYLHLNFDPLIHATFQLINFFTLKSNPYYLEEKIIECFNKAIQIVPGFLDAWHNLGLFYYDLEDYENAIRCFKEILEKNSEIIEAWYFLGKSYQELKKYNLELKCLKKTLTLSHHKHNLPIKKIKKRVEKLGKVLNKTKI